MSINEKTHYNCHGKILSPHRGTYSKIIAYPSSRGLSYSKYFIQYYQSTVHTV